MIFLNEHVQEKNINIEELKKEVIECIQSKTYISLKMTCQGIHLATNVVDNKDIEFLFNQTISKENEGFPILCVTQHNEQQKTDVISLASDGPENNDTNSSINLNTS